MITPNTSLRRIIVILTALFLMQGIGHAEPPKELNGFNLSKCTIPAGNIHKGGPPRDGIPALTTPKTIAAAEASYLEKDDRVIGVEINESARAYPLRILTWHENVNDVLGDRPIAVTYCPLCNSATVFDRKVGGKVREFGISGLLWNSNVLLYDRQENGKSSLWSQVGMRAVCGPAAEKGLTLKLLSSQLTSWDKWRSNHPGTSVLSTQTGHRRGYDRNPYRRYFSHQRLMFPVSASKKELADYPRKEMVVMVRVNDARKAYPISEIKKAVDEDNTLQDTVGKVPLSLHYDRSDNTVIVSPEDDAPAKKDIGTAYMFWFAWKSVYPDSPVYTAE